MASGRIGKAAVAATTSFDEALVTVKEAVADAQVELSHQESAEAGSGASRARTCQDGGAEQSDLGQRPTNLRACDSRVRSVVLLRPPACVQSHRCALVSDPPRITRIRAGDDQSSVSRCSYRVSGLSLDRLGKTMLY